MLQHYDNPFQALLALQNQLDARRKSGFLSNYTTAGGTYPPINIFQKGDDYVAIVELAGVDKDKLDIQIKNNTIRLSGEKTANYPENISVHRSERIFGKFDRTITVPVKVDSAAVSAEYRDGILALLIPRAEEDKPRKVAIS